MMRIYVVPRAFIRLHNFGLICLVGEWIEMCAIIAKKERIASIDNVWKSKFSLTDYLQMLTNHPS